MGLFCNSEKGMDTLTNFALNILATAGGAALFYLLFSDGCSEQG